MILLVAEKPSVARDHYQKMLQRVAGESFVQRDGYLEGKEHIITWCVGHLVTLAPFDAYDGYEGSWKLSTLPLLPDQYRLQIIERTEKQYNIVRQCMERADVIVNGADAGREGNLIFDLVLDVNSELKQKNLKRLWVNSYVDQDLDNAWKALEENSFRENLSFAARLRQRADWLVGLNATRAYTLTAGHGRLLSVGRVQTPTLSLVVQRDTDVEGFQELFYYGSEGLWQGVRAQWIEEDKVSWVEEKALAERVVKKTDGQAAILTSWKKSTKKSFPSKPFDLTDLQKEANKRFKFKAAQTLELAQGLYEKKHISYPRTDSAYLNDAMKKESYNLAAKLASSEQKVLLRPETDSFTFVNSKKVTDHYAILPTSHIPRALSNEEGKLYNLIKERFITAWLEPQIWKEATGLLECVETVYRMRLKVEEQTGWKGLHAKAKEEGKDEKESDTDDSSAWVSEMPSWKVGDSAMLAQVQLVEKKKSKPKYYTEATLLTAMKTAGRQIEDEELAEAMKDRGLGTPATQANILETLKQREFLAEEKGYLYSTPRGRALISNVDDQLKSAELTGDWEYKLKQVERGEYSPKAFYDGICDFVKKFFGGLRQNYSVDFERENKSWDVDCLKCSQKMQALNWGLICSVESCDFKVPFSVAGRGLSTEEIESLLAGQELKDLQGFRSKRGFAFQAGLKFDDKLELSLLFTDDPKKAFQKFKGKCPACKGELSENQKMIRCDGDRCSFVLWKVVAQKELAKKEIGLLLKKKPTETIEGFLSKKGKEFSAKLEMGSDFKIKFVFENTGGNNSKSATSSASRTSLSCPCCGYEVSKNKENYYCNMMQCGWFTPLSLASRSLEESEIADLGKNKITALLSGFKGKNGEVFSAKLILNEKAQVKFDLGSIVKS